MGTFEACPPAPLLLHARMDRPLAVIGITHAQTCLVMRGRLRALREAGFRVILISSPGYLADQLVRDEGAELVAIPMRRDIAPLSDLIALFRLCAALHRVRPAITEFSTPKAGFLGNIAAFLCRIPKRVYLLRGLRLETANGFRRWLLKRAECIAAACAHVVVCNSESLRQRAFALGMAPAGKLRLIADGSSNGVDVHRFAPGPDEMRGQLGIPSDEPVIGFVGRLTRDKGIPELVTAFEGLLHRAPHAWLLLVGWFDDSEDALRPEERKRIGAHPRIICTGFVADTVPYYRAMDVMVLPTWREGFPNAALEAAASGIPVITTMTTGARDAVLPGVTGLLVPPGNPGALAQSILHLLDEERGRASMGRAGRRWVMRRFMSGRVLDVTASLYRTLLNESEAKAVGARPKDVAAAAD